MCRCRWLVMLCVFIRSIRGTFPPSLCCCSFYTPSRRSYFVTQRRNLITDSVNALFSRWSNSLIHSHARPPTVRALALVADMAFRIHSLEKGGARGLNDGRTCKTLFLAKLFPSLTYTLKILRNVSWPINGHEKDVVVVLVVVVVVAAAVDYRTTIWHFTSCQWGQKILYSFSKFIERSTSRRNFSPLLAANEKLFLIWKTTCSLLEWVSICRER